MVDLRTLQVGDKVTPLLGTKIYTVTERDVYYDQYGLLNSLYLNLEHSLSKEAYQNVHFGTHGEFLHHYGDPQWPYDDIRGINDKFKNLDPLIDAISAGETKDTNPKESIGIRKIPYSCVPDNVTAAVAVALLEGGIKYGRHNYRDAGVLASVYYDATRRHLGAYWEGEDIDPESGLPHVIKAIASLTVLADAMMNGMVDDDRPPKVESGWMDELNRKVGELLDKYPERKEAHRDDTSKAD